MVRQVEKINTEYALFSTGYVEEVMGLVVSIIPDKLTDVVDLVKYEAESLEEALLFINKSIYQADDYRCDLMVQRGKNKRRRVVSTLLGELGFFWGICSPSFYKNDNAVILYQGDMLENYCEQLLALKNVANEENFAEVDCLARFTRLKYEVYKASIDEDRYAAECFDLNAVLIDIFPGEQFAAFSEFFKGAIKSITCHDALVNEKK